MPRPAAPAAAKSPRAFAPWWGWLALIAACFVIYWPALHGTPLWDDDAHLTRPELRDAFGLARIWFEIGATQQYYPLLHSAFWLQHKVWGDVTTGYHVINILLHASAAGLLALIMRRLQLRGAWLAAALFALHPVLVESVAWISELKNTLSTVFALLAMLAWLRFEDREETSGTKAWRAYTLAALAFLLAALTKTVTVTLPAAFLVIAWWRRGRLNWQRDVFPLVPWFIFAGIAAITTAAVEQDLIGAQGEAYALTLLERTQLAGRIVWFYFGKLLWPSDLMFIYPRWDATAIGWLPLLAAIGAIGALAWHARRQRGPLTTALLYGGTLFPALGFINVYPFQYSYVADHFQYFASLAVFAALGHGLTLTADRFFRPRFAVLTSAAAMLLALATLSWRQAHDYRDSVTHYRAMLANNPACWMAAYNLGLEYANRGDYPTAIPLYLEALRLKPDYAEVHSNLGLALLNTGAPPAEARAEFETALRLKPSLWQTRANLANTLMGTGREAEALAHYWRAVIEQPSVAWLRLNLGYALQTNPAHRAAAVRQFHTALALQPDYWEAEYSIAALLLGWPGREHEAIPHLEAVRRLNPDFAPARQLLERLRR